MKPVIDVHTHIFSAKDIPLKGYLLSRKYEGIIIKNLSKVVIPWIARCIRNKKENDKKFFSRLKCRLMMEIVKTVMGKGYVKWGDTLSKDVVIIAKKMIETYSDDGTDLFIPLMIDYEYWFINSPDRHLKCQIDSLYKNIILPFKGKIHPFVAFDPARELAFRKELCDPDSNKEKYGSLQLVKNAIEKYGFIGVKLYNSMGYKPFNNADVEDKRKKIAYHQDKYVFSGEEYDQVLSELYDYCIDNEVPITTHCGMYGIESYPDASFDFGQAIFWCEVLEQERYKDLRLNLAHFGWYEKEGFEGKITWVKDICWMMKHYAHLFADISCHKVTKTKNLTKFKEDYKKMCKQFPIVKKRLLFGTDWQVLLKEPNYRKFKENYVEVLSKENNNDKDHRFNNDEIENFLGGNALNFLGLKPGGKNLERLEKFYKKNKIKTPKWLTKIKSSGNDDVV